MKKTLQCAAVLLLLATLNAHLVTAFAQGTAFTYQGRLNNSGSPTSGSYDLAFRLFATNTTGAAIAAPVTNNATAVTNGLFTTTLDFGAGVFTGGSNWLEIAVSTNGANAFSTLVPRQQLTPVPYAIFAGTASNVSGTISAAQLPGSPGFAGTVTATAFAGNGANVTNVNAAALNGLNATNFWQTGGNSGTTPGTQFVGTTDNQALEFKVNGSRALRLEPNATSPNVIGGYSGNYLVAGLVGAVISGGGANVNTNSIFADYSAIGGGSGNTIQTSAYDSTIGGGYVNTIQPNAHDSTIGGGTGHTIQTGAYESVIGGGYGNRIQTNASSSTIGGGQQNTIQTGASESTIGGGSGNAIQPNAYDSTIGGGYQNTIQPNANDSTIGGGYQNTIQTNAYVSTIGGGHNNTIQPYANDSAIGGGVYNTIQTNANYSTIGGGYSNNVSGNYATVPGGANNIAGGQFSFAAGHDAQALHQGAFVWADSQYTTFASTANDQFLIRAQGGVGINTASPQQDLSVNGGMNIDQAQQNVGTIAHALSFGSGAGEGIGSDRSGLHADSWGLNFYTDYTKRITILQHGNVGIGTNNPAAALHVVGNIIASGTVTANGVLLTSDRNAKENFISINAREVLAKVSALPVTEWNYKDDGADKKHIGPMAQDFYAAFRLDGDDDKHISVVDEGGVALAAIQGLNQKVEEKDAEIQDLKQSVAELRELVSKLVQTKQQLTTTK